MSFGSVYSHSWSGAIWSHHEVQLLPSGRRLRKPSMRLQCHMGGERTWLVCGRQKKVVQGLLRTPSPVSNSPSQLASRPATRLVHLWCLHGKCWIGKIASHQCGIIKPNHQCGIIKPNCANSGIISGASDSGTPPNKDWVNGGNNHQAPDADRRIGDEVWCAKPLGGIQVGRVGIWLHSTTTWHHVAFNCFQQRR